MNFFNFFSSTSLSNSFTSLFSYQSNDQTKSREVDEKEPLLPAEDKKSNAKAPTTDPNQVGKEAGVKSPTILSRMRRVIFGEEKHARIPQEEKESLIHLPSKDLSPKAENVVVASGRPPMVMMNLEAKLEAKMHTQEARRVAKLTKEQNLDRRQALSDTTSQTPIQTTEPSVFETLTGGLVATQKSAEELKKTSERAIVDASEQAQNAVTRATSFFEGLMPPSGPVEPKAEAVTNGPEAKAVTNGPKAPIYDRIPVFRTSLKWRERLEEINNRTDPQPFTGKKLDEHVANTPKTGGNASKSHRSDERDSTKASSSGSEKSDKSKKSASSNGSRSSSTSSKSTTVGGYRVMGSQATIQEQQEFLVATDRPPLSGIGRIEMEKANKKIEAKLKEKAADIITDQRRISRQFGLGPYGDIDVIMKNPYSGVVVTDSTKDHSSIVGKYTNNQGGGGRGGR